MSEVDALNHRTGNDKLLGSDWKNKMNLIISDRSITLPPKELEKVTVIDLSSLEIHGCVGCFGCWVKTPGKCVIRDDAVQVYPQIARSQRIIYISRVRYGGYDTPMKTMLERAIPVQQAFIRLFRGETHHVQRRVADKDAIIIAYGEISQEEQHVFSQLVARNAYNMNFSQYKILFVPEQEVDSAVEKVVMTWKR